MNKKTLIIRGCVVLVLIIFILCGLKSIHIKQDLIYKPHVCSNLHKVLNLLNNSELSNEEIINSRLSQLKLIK